MTGNWIQTEIADNIKPECFCWSVIALLDFWAESLGHTQKLLCSCLWFSWGNFTLALGVMLLFLHSLMYIIQSLTGDHLPRIARTPYTPVSMCCTPEHSSTCSLLGLSQTAAVHIPSPPECPWSSLGGLQVCTAACGMFGRPLCAKTGIFVTLSTARIAMTHPWQKF